MRNTINVLSAVCILGIAGTAHAQQATLAGTVGVYIFPADGQEAAEQSRDEADCYRWAVDNTGADPFDLARTAEQQQAQAQRAGQAAQQAGQGAAAGGAIGGAATGALVGSVFGSSSKSRKRLARAGAVVGAAGGASARAEAQAQAGRAAAQAERGARATEEQLAGFRKAFSACMEANDYVAKF
jgi:hypothetical protein